MLPAWIILFAVTAQDPPLEVVSELLAAGGRLEYEVRVEPGGVKVRHGAFTLYGADDNKRVLGKYKDGVKSGRWNYRYDDGNPWVTGVYREGARHGKWTFRHPNREVRAEGSYDEGLPTGTWSFFDAGGSLVARDSGTYTPIVSYYQGADREYVGQLLDDQPHGRWTFYWKDGSRMLEGEFDRGERVGMWRFWHSDGTYDPLLLSHYHGAGRESAELYAEPVAVPEEDSNVAALEASSQATQSGPRPANLQALKVESSIESLHGLMKDPGALEALKARGRDALPAVLEGLRQLNYANEVDVVLARDVLWNLVRPIFRGHGLVAPEGPPDADRIRLGVLRAHSLYCLTRSSAHWWELDLEVVHGDPLQAMSDVLKSPPVPVESLYSAAGAGPYERRFAKDRNLLAVGGGGTEQALRDALTWLVKNQYEDGHWSSGDGYHDVGVTGLALLALLGDGHTLERGAYQDSVLRAVRWLMRLQDEDSGFFSKKYEVDDPQSGQRMLRWSTMHLYDHAVVTQAICELTQLSGSPGVREAARKAVRFITRSRNPYGVWRYDSPPMGDNDTSMTTWMMSAVIAAERAGIEIDRQPLDIATLTWLDEVTAHSGRVGYDEHGGPSMRYAGINDWYPRDKTEAMTAAGLWLRMRLGEDPAKIPILLRHADLILKNLPVWDDFGRTNDLYYWYHGSYAMRNIGGKHWEAWNVALKKALLESQEQEGANAGSWKPNGTWSHFGGRAYSTAMAALCLEVYFRLPLER